MNERVWSQPRSSLYCRGVSRQRAFAERFAHLQARMRRLKVRCGTAVVNTYVVRDAVLRSRATRSGERWRPEPVENFVIDRSGHNH